MAADLPTLEVWDTLPSQEREEIARALEKRLPAQFRFDGLEIHQLGEQQHVVAFYRWSKNTQRPGEDRARPAAEDDRAETARAEASRQA
jgi:hypothetical protein